MWWCEHCWQHPACRSLCAAPSHNLPVLPKHFSKLCDKLVTKWKPIVNALDKPRGSNFQYILVVVVRNSAVERKGYWEGSNWTSHSFQYFFLVGCCQMFCRLLFHSYIQKQIDVPLNTAFCIHLQKFNVNFGPDLFQWKFRISCCCGGYNITVLLGNLKITEIGRCIKLWSCSPLSYFVKPMSYMPGCLEFCYGILLMDKTKHLCA